VKGVAERTGASRHFCRLISLTSHRSGGTRWGPRRAVASRLHGREGTASAHCTSGPPCRCAATVWAVP